MKENQDEVLQPLARIRKTLGARLLDSAIAHLLDYRSRGRLLACTANPKNAEKLLQEYEMVAEDEAMLLFCFSSGINGPLGLLRSVLPDDSILSASKKAGFCASTFEQAVELAEESVYDMRYVLEHQTIPNSFLPSPVPGMGLYRVALIQLENAEWYRQRWPTNDGAIDGKNLYWLRHQRYIRGLATTAVLNQPSTAFEVLPGKFVHRTFENKSED